MEQILIELSKLGLPGLFIAYLMWRNSKQDERYDALAKLVNEVQERRANERAESAKALADSAAAQIRMAQTVDDATERIVASVQVAVQTMAANTRAQMGTK